MKTIAFRTVCSVERKKMSGRQPKRSTEYVPTAVYCTECPVTHSQLYCDWVNGNPSKLVLKE